MTANSSADDWSDSEEFREFARAVRAELLPKLHASAMVVSLLGRNRADVKFAVETGLAVLLDKPILVVVSPGVQVPNKLVLVADHIVEADLTTAVGRDKLAARLTEIITEYYLLNPR